RYQSPSWAHAGLGARSPAAAALIRRAASMPSSTGIRPSISTTSGCRSAQTRTASGPSAALPTTVKSGWVASSAPYPARTTSWSSTTTIRTGSAMPGPGDMLSPGQRQHRLDQEAADRRRPGPQLPADHGGAVSHAGQAAPAALVVRATGTTGAGTAGTDPSAAGAAARRTTSAGATGAGAAVPDPQPQRVPAVVQLHIDRRARGVPAGVGERLLHDAV